jgi:predicted nucleic acid-binding protein
MDTQKSSLLIDTDVLINFFDKTKKFHLKAQTDFYEFNDKKIEPCISVITTIEMIQGSKNNIEKNKILKQIEPFDVVFLSPEICTVTRDLIITYSSSHGLLMGDAFIAASALYLDIPLFTFNKKDFRFIKGLKLYGS